jgi:hypothetical protein
MADRLAACLHALYGFSDATVAVSRKMLNRVPAACDWLIEQGLQSDDEGYCAARHPSYSHRVDDPGKPEQRVLAVQYAVGSNKAAFCIDFECQDMCWQQQMTECFKTCRQLQLVHHPVDGLGCHPLRLPGRYCRLPGARRLCIPPHPARRCERLVS